MKKLLTIAIAFLGLTSQASLSAISLTTLTSDIARIAIGIGGITAGRILCIKSANEAQKLQKNNPDAKELKTTQDYITIAKPLALQLSGYALVLFGMGAAIKGSFDLAGISNHAHRRTLRI